MNPKTFFIFICLVFLVCSVSFAENPLDETQQKAMIEARQKYQQAAEQAKWDDLSIEFRKIEENPATGFIEMKLESPDGKKYEKTVYVSPIIEMDIKDIVSINVAYRPGSTGQLLLVVKFNKIGREKLKDVTSKNIKKQLGIIIDGKLKRAPEIAETIESGEIQIDGFGPEEAVSILDRYYKPLMPGALFFQRK